MDPIVLILLAGCLERIHEGTVPLDERFTSLPESSQPEAPAEPFADLDGDSVMLSGTVQAERDLPVDMDFRQPDPEAEGGQRNLGKLALAGPGPWELAAPADFGNLRIEVFQDLSGDGPTDDDPFAWRELEIGTEPAAGIDFELVDGARAELAERLGGGIGVLKGPLAEAEGDRVTLEGTVFSDGDGPVDVDFRDAAGEEALGKLVLESPGPFSVELPEGAGALQLQAFQDLGRDGPSDDDPFGWVDLEVGSEPVAGVEIHLEPGGKEALAAEMGHDDGGAESPPGPFEGYDGPWTLLHGTISSRAEGAVDVDLRRPDPESPGGNRALGKVPLAGPGPYEIEVPRGLGVLLIDAFQDRDHDGPSADDPYAEAELRVGEEEEIELDLELVVGARGLPGGGQAPAPPGEGQAAPSGPGASGPFPELGEDQGIRLSGTLRLGEGVTRAEVVDLDIFTRDQEAPGGRRYLGKLKLAPGAFSFRVPAELHSVELEAFVDSDGDGPTPGDPFGTCPCNPLALDGRDVDGVDIELEPTSR